MEIRTLAAADAPAGTRIASGDDTEVAEKIETVAAVATEAEVFPIAAAF